MIFQYAIDGNSLEKIQNLLLEKDMPSPSGNKKWPRVAIDKLLNNIKYFERVIPNEGFFKAYNGKSEQSTHFRMEMQFGKVLGQPHFLLCGCPFFNTRHRCGASGQNRTDNLRFTIPLLCH